VKIGIGANRKTVVGRKRDTDKSGNVIKITGTACSSSIVGSKTSSYQLLGTALSAMAIIGMIDQIGNIGTMIGILMGRLEEDSVCMTGLEIVSSIFPEIKRSLRRWRMHESLMNSYFAEMLILIRWNQQEIIANQ